MLVESTFSASLPENDIYLRKRLSNLIGVRWQLMHSVIMSSTHALQLNERDYINHVLYMMQCTLHCRASNGPVNLAL